jgi:hypothetical protein
MASWIIVSISSALIGISLGLQVHELPARVDGLGIDLSADRRLVDLHPGAGQVAQQLADDVVVGDRLEIRSDEVAGIAVASTEVSPSIRRPQPEQPVAACVHPELHLLVARELGLECALALVESGHGPAILLLCASR